MTSNRDTKGRFIKGMKYNDKECHICGASYTPTNLRSKFCSKDCRLSNNRIAGRKRWLCPEYRAKHREGNLLRRYNISQTAYDTMLSNQGGVCKICRKTPKDNGRTLPVDHCHLTGKMRGLLCDVCNRSLGLLGDDVGRLLTASFYLMEYLDD